MILYYAMGDGLGHLTRARAFLHTLHIREPVTLLTASPLAQDPRVVGSARVIQVPAGLPAQLPVYRTWLGDVIDRVRPHAIYLDAFPAGLLGEWCDFPLPGHIALHHVARLLRWPAYRARLWGTPPVLATTYVLEALTAEHEAFLRQQSTCLLPLDLHDPPLPPHCLVPPPGFRGPHQRHPLWLIIHAGSAAEVLELVAYAEETSVLEELRPRLLLLTPQRPAHLPAHVISCQPYPATPFLSVAERIITACGFNSMRQAAAYRERHRFLPFPRRLDDQFMRAARHRRPA